MTFLNQKSLDCRFSPLNIPARCMWTWFILTFQNIVIKCNQENDEQLMAHCSPQPFSKVSRLGSQEIWKRDSVLCCQATWSVVLKEQCHEKFAVLGQFCAKNITLRLEDIKWILSKGLTIINFLRIFGTRHKILKKLASFFKFQSSSMHAIRSDRRQETLSVPSNSLQ